MPYSDNRLDTQLAVWVRANIPTTGVLLDVGAGAGKFSAVFPDYTMDAVEFFINYHTIFKLHSKYRKVWGLTIQDFIHQIGFDGYACIVMGDVLEHLSIEDAQFVVTSFVESKVPFIIKVPFLLPQVITPDVVAQFPEITGNHLEGHLQPDLTNDVMLSRYPNLSTLICDDAFGLYISKV